jgi:hypothetical protein
MAAKNKTFEPTSEPYPVKQPYQPSRAKCAQCGTEMRYVPFALDNIMCRDCYGMDRYRRPAATVPAAEKPIEMTATDEAATTVEA